MSSPAGLRGSIEEEADAAAAAGNVALALTLLEQATVSPEASPELWLKLTAMRRAAGDVSGALKSVERALALAPLNFSALLSRALILDRMADGRAGEAFGHALAQAPPTDRIPPALAKTVDYARSKAAAHQERVEEHLNSVIPRRLSDVERRRVERFVSNTSRRTRQFHQEPSSFNYPGLPEIEFHEQELFPELYALESLTEVIRGEFEALVAADAAEMVPYIQYPEHVPLAQWRELNRNRDWTAIHLLQNGEMVSANADRCPATMAALVNLPQPQIRGASPNAMFSLLAPRTRIPPHTGVANTRLVCHLPLIVPPGCGFRVGATTHEWRVGEALVFDDTIEHEAWNDSDKLRVVLIVDLWQPSLSAQERAAVTAIIEAAGASFGGG